MGGPTHISRDNTMYSISSFIYLFISALFLNKSRGTHNFTKKKSYLLMHQAVKKLCLSPWTTIDLSSIMLLCFFYEGFIGYDKINDASCGS